ncbi:hypothetical protein Tco_0548518 [Tanacetum coccineum]
MSLSLAENVIVAWVDNHPPMLDKTQYSSWASRMLLYIKGKENGKLLVESVFNGPFKYGIVTVPGTPTTPTTVRDRTYEELTDAEKLPEACDIKATNIVLQGLPQDIYNLVNHHEEAKDIWDRVKLLIEGSEISLQERESKLYDEFDMFSLVPGETIHSYYLRFAQLINNMHSIGMTMRPIQVNIKFINHLQPEWSKIVTNVKLAKELNNTNFDQLYAYLRQHEAHADETQYHKQILPFASQQQVSPLASQQLYDVPMIQQRSSQAPVANYSSMVHHQSYQTPDVNQPSQASFPLMDSGLVVASFLPSGDIIASLNKAMAFISTAFTSRYPPTNNQLRTSSNPRNQATIQDGRCTKPKRPRNSAWFKEKAMLAEALESGIVLDEEQIAFLADNGDIVTISQQSQEIPTPAAFQTDDLDAFDSDCDEAPSASSILMAKLCSYDLAALSKTCKTENAVVQDTSSSTQNDAMIMFVIEEMSNQVAKCNEVDKEKIIINESITAELERYKEQIKLFEERKHFDLNGREKYIDGQLRKVIVEKNAKVADFENQIYSLKQQLNATVESHKTLSTTVDVLKTESKEKEDKYLDEIIELEKQKKALDNHAALFVIDIGETLKLAEESRLKMHTKQNDLIVQEKKVNIEPIDYVALNKLSKHFVKHFVP